MPARRLARLVASVLLLLALGGCGVFDEPAGVVRLDSLALRRGATPPPPPIGATLDLAALADLGGWERVAVPDVWGLRQRARGVAGWYRGELVLPKDAHDWAIHFDGSYQDMEVFADGVRLGSSQRALSRLPGAPLASAPFVVPLPDGRERIELALYFRTAPSELGMLTRAVAGPREWIAERAQWILLLRRSLPTALGIIGLAGGLMVLLLARLSDEPGAYWFGISTSLWCLTNLVPTEPTSTFGWLATVVAHGFVPAVVFGFHRVLALRRPRIETVLAGTVVVSATARALVPPLLIPAVDISWWLVNLLIGLYLLPLVVRSERVRATTGSRWVLFAGLVLVLAGVHDTASLLAGRVLLAPFSLFAAASPVIAVATAGAVVAALAEALRRVRVMNVELENRVEEKRRELAASYARTAELERERAIAGERERMMRDLHDGTGGQLVSALSLVEGGDVRAEELAEALRAALSDLRLTIDSLEAGPADLLALLAHARTRLESRLEHHGVRFSWEVEDIATPAGFGPEQSLHVLRIFQEAVTNALKHARAKTIAVRTGNVHDDAGRRLIFIEIADDGRGLGTPAEAVTDGSHRGLRNMRRRAAEIGGHCAITSAAQGTTVRLLVPIEPTPRPS